MADRTAEIIPFPIRKRPLGGLREAVGRLRSHELLFTAGALMNLALEAYEFSNDADFYERVEAAHLALERLLAERGRI